jgi:DnaJ-class molecular chaperone
MQRQRCAHLAALHCALGWLNDDPTPEPTPISTCGECGGMGEIQDLEVRQHGRYQMQWVACTACAGAGKRSLDHAA